jgi:glutathione S-transferase
MAPPDLRAIHPLGKPPVVSNDKVIAEFAAIIDYIIRRYGNGRLQPDQSSGAYDAYVRWLHYAEGPTVVTFIMSQLPTPMFQPHHEVAANFVRRTGISFFASWNYPCTKASGSNDVAMGRPYIV